MVRSWTNTLKILYQIRTTVAPSKSNPTKWDPNDVNDNEQKFDKIQDTNVYRLAQIV